MKFLTKETKKSVTVATVSCFGILSLYNQILQEDLSFMNWNS